MFTDAILSETMDPSDKSQYHSSDDRYANICNI
jgi:hypothetical protein